mmetsp:Transcript_13048/g.19504  ORF Transcript_13048/g.19504 Transcript_13048/m.19504 type:complete len:121 (+) Transcript_13048:11-373(+)
MSDLSDERDSDYAPDKINSKDEASEFSKENLGALEPISRKRKEKVDKLWNEMNGPTNVSTNFPKKQKVRNTKASKVLASIFGSSKASEILEKVDQSKKTKMEENSEKPKKNEKCSEKGRC